MAWELTGNSGTNPLTNFLGTRDNQPLVIKTNGSERLRIALNGNIGIGTAQPGAKLEINNGDLLFKAAAEDPGDIIFQSSLGGQKGRIWSHAVAGAGLYFSSGDNNPDISIDAAGNVGIGTTSPNERLTVEYNIPDTAAIRGVNLSSDSQSLRGGIGVKGEGGQWGVWGTGSHVGVFGQGTTTGVQGDAQITGVAGYSNSQLAYGAGVSGRTYSPNGVGVEALSDGLQPSNLGLRVLGRADVSGEIVVGTAWPTQTAGFANIRLGADTGNDDIEIGSTNSSIRDVAFWNSGGVFFMNTVAEKVFNTGTPTRSDARLKTNIRSLTGVLEKLEQIHGVSFEWNDRHRSPFHVTGSREIGVIAQEVEAIFPELTSTWGAKGYKAVDYGRLAAVLVEAVKELRAEIATSRLRLVALERLVIRSKAGTEVGSVS